MHKVLEGREIGKSPCHRLMDRKLQLNHIFPSCHVSSRYQIQMFKNQMCQLEATLIYNCLTDFNLTASASPAYGSWTSEVISLPLVVLLEQNIKCKFISNASTKSWTIYYALVGVTFLRNARDNFFFLRNVQWKHHLTDFTLDNSKGCCRWLLQNLQPHCRTHCFHLEPVGGLYSMSEWEDEFM